MKAAYLGSPGLYGLFSVFRNLRAGLQPQGIELRWIGHGRWAADAFQDLRWESERPLGEIVGPDSTDFDFLGKSLVTHLTDHGYQAVFINPPQNSSEMNVARYLPANILRIMIVQMMGRGIYRLCEGIRDHVHATVGLSPRLRDDLINHHHFDPARTTACAGIDLTNYRDLPARSASSTLRLLYFGRITDGQKGVFHLPTIMNLLSNEKVELTVAGDGEDLPELKSRCAQQADRVRFLGPVPSREIPSLLNRHDVFIFPTRSEGLGYVLLEALAGGCVPVVSRIRGITDHLVHDGETGLLFPVDHAKQAADHIRRLSGDRQLLSRLSIAGVADCSQRFDALVAGKTYADLLRSLAASPPPIAQPLSLDQWNYPRQFNQGWRRYIPESFKNFIRARVAKR
jgi:glycosyltransferase involved in cell wall biosynthesis